MRTVHITKLLLLKTLYERALLGGQLILPLMFQPLKVITCLKKPPGILPAA